MGYKQVVKHVVVLSHAEFLEMIEDRYGIPDVPLKVQATCQGLSGVTTGIDLKHGIQIAWTVERDISDEPEKA